MGFFNRFNKLFGVRNVEFETIDLKNETIDITQDTSISIWDNDNPSGRITEEEALSIAPLYAGVNLICSSVASLPINLYKIEMETGEKELIRNDYRNNLLNISNNMFESSYNLKYSIVKNLILHGTAYVYMVKGARNRIESLYFLDNGDVNGQLIKVGNLYDYKFGFTFFQDYVNCGSDEMIVFSRNQKRSTDLEGRGILDLNKELLNLALQETTTANNALTNKFPAYLSTQDALSPNAKANIRKSFKGLSKNNEIPIFEEGLTYTQLSTSSKELELLESRQYTTQLVSNILNLPLSFLTSASSYNTSEEESLRFQRTILPYIRLIEETFNKFLLTSRELDNGYRFEFDIDALMKISRTEFMDYLSRGIQAGIFTINEARQEMNLSARENGDISELPVNMYFLDEQGNIILPSQNENGVVEEEKEDLEVVEEKKEDNQLDED